MLQKKVPKYRDSINNALSKIMHTKSPLLHQNKSKKRNQNMRYVFSLYNLLVSSQAYYRHTKYRSFCR